MGIAMIYIIALLRCAHSIVEALPGAFGSRNEALQSSSSISTSSSVHSGLRHMGNYLISARGVTEECWQIPKRMKLRKQLEDMRSKGHLPIECSGLVPLADAISYSTDILALTNDAELVVLALQHIIQDARHMWEWAHHLNAYLHHVRHALHDIQHQHPERQNLPNEQHSMDRLGRECKLLTLADTHSLALLLQVENTLDRLIHAVQRHLS